MKNLHLYIILFSSTLLFFRYDNKMKDNNIITKKVLDADSILYNILKQFDVLDYLTPSNLYDEKKVFFDKINIGQKYNTQFRYPKISINYSSLLKELHKINLKKTLLSAIIFEKRDGIIKQINLLKNIGNDAKFSESSVNLYGLPS